MSTTVAQSRQRGGARSAASLSVVVPATDRRPSLDAATAAIRAGLAEGDELVVQTTPEGCGPALARNLGAQRSSGDVLVFVDADVIVDPDALARIRLLMSDPAGPDVVFGAYDADPADPGLVSRYRNLLHHHVHNESAGPAETFWAGLGAIRRGHFEALGGFDALRFRRPSVEDIELGSRLRANGARIVLDPEIEGKHLKRWTLAGMLRVDHAYRARPWARLLIESPARPPAVLNLTRRRRLSSAMSIAIAASLLARRPRVAAAALAAVAVLNRRFLSLLLERGGPRLAIAGLGLQVLHEIAAASAVPVAIAQHTVAGGGRTTGPLS